MMFTNIAQYSPYCFASPHRAMAGFALYTEYVTVVHCRTWQIRLQGLVNIKEAPTRTSTAGDYKAAFIRVCI